MQLVLDMGRGLDSAWAQERRWHGPAFALAVHLAVAALWLSWPDGPPPALDDQIIELVLAPPPPAEPEPPAAPVKPATPPPMAKPVMAKPAPPASALAAKPTPAAPVSAATAAAPTAAVESPAPVSPAPAPAPAAAAPREPDLTPSPTETPRPVYPRAARQRGWQGVVMVLVRVAEDGQPLDVAVKESSGHTVLDDAALDAVKRWRFAPARQNGRPVIAAVEVPVRFSLEG